MRNKQFLKCNKCFRGNKSTKFRVWKKHTCFILLLTSFKLWTSSYVTKHSFLYPVCLSCFFQFSTQFPHFQEVIFSYLKFHICIPIPVWMKTRKSILCVSTCTKYVSIMYHIPQVSSSEKEYKLQFKNDIIFSIAFVPTFLDA